VNEQTIIDALLGGYRFVLPEIVLGVTACVLFLGGTVRAGRNLGGAAALLGLGGAALALTLPDAPARTDVSRATVFSAPVILDSLAVLVKFIAIGGGVVLVLFGWHEVGDNQAADFHACLLLIVAGVCLAASANDLVTLFLALELVSIPTYVMLYLPRHDTPAQEAAVKYFLLSVFSSALLLFGFSYLYGLAGTTNLAALLDTASLTEGRDLPGLAPVAVILVVAGLGFRITAVPFHFYAPDVYQGTSTVMAALLAFITKVVGFVALLRVLGFVLPVEVVAHVGAVGRAFQQIGVVEPLHPIGTALSDQVPLLLWFLAAFTMSVGNVLALLQDNLKRLLAYSSVAHAGYMLVALAAAPYLRQAAGTQDAWVPDGVEALLFYLVAYGAMTLGAFAVIARLDSPQRPVQDVDDLAGLSSSHPGVALVMALFLFSLIGVPLTAGFTGKLLIFFGAMAVPAPYATLFQVLAVVGMVNAAIGGWYYLRIVAVMYLRTPIRPLEKRGSWSGAATLGICVLLTAGLSVPPGVQWLLQATSAASGVPVTAAK
jgi:NADH-quinone oxidoreductase subunit N